MTQITDQQQQRLEDAARSVGAKLQAFHDGLSPDERLVLGAALQPFSAGADEPADDTAGHVLAGVVTLPVAAAAARQIELRQKFARIFGFSL
ncbi:MAG: hypothetical protein ACRDJE_04100 [Dehalococcoidia bacterium]